jgi:hypothetical protein
MKKIPVKELDAILAEVSAQLEPVVKAEVQKAAEKLSKAVPGEGTTDEVPKDASATKEAPDDKADAPPKAEDKPPAAEPPAAEPPAAEPPAAEPPAAEPPVAEDGLTDPDADIDSPEALQAAYSALPLEELQVHYIAVRAAVMAAMPQAAPAPEAPLAAPPVAAPPMAAPPAAAPMDPMADPAFKAEMPADPNGSVEAVKKSEKIIEDLTKKLADQNKVIAELIDISAALKKHAERPLRKSVASISEVRRNAPASAAAAVDLTSLSKSEMKVLVRKTIDKALSPNDRARMHDFISNSYENVESVKDLLTLA